MRGTSVLLVPGMMLDDRLYAPQIAALRSSCSVKVADISRQESIEALARSVLLSAPERFVLVGLSMGGIVALEMYRQASARISHLALLGTTPHADRPARAPVRRAQLDAVSRGQLKEVLQSDIKSSYLGVRTDASPDLQALLLAIGLQLGPPVFRRQTQALLTRPDASDVLPTIRCPTLVLCGSEDALCPPPIHQQMARAIPAAELRVLADIGHISTLEAPEAVTDALLALMRRDGVLAA